MIPQWLRDLIDRLYEILVVSTPTPIVVPPPPPPVPKYLWDTVDHIKHSIRVICDEEGHTLEDKNTMFATIWAESGFNLYAKNENKNHAGVVTSTDWGLCQINDYYHIGHGRDFPSVDYVLHNPEVIVRWMARLWKAGKRNLWSAYKFGAYKRYL